jgi:hypothetical protein
MKIEKIEMKGYRSCRSNEGDAYSYALHVNGKRVADVQYDGWGGPVDFRWLPGTNAVKAALYAHVQPLVVARVAAEEAALRTKHTKHPQGMEWGWWAGCLQEDPQAALEEHLNHQQASVKALASLKRRVAKSIVVVREGDAPGTSYTVAAAPTPENIARVEARESAKKGRVLNTRPESEWLGLLGL